MKYAFVANGLLNHNTGRLSSDSPNGQQFPRKSNDPLSFQYHSDIKTMFTSRFKDDGVILQIDYSQLELRILAVITKDPTLIEEYRQGKDLHKVNASQSFGIPEAEVTKDMRTFAKKVSFGVVYQESAKGLADDLVAEGIETTESQCQEFIDKWYKKYSLVDKWVKDTRRFVTRNRYVRSALGRLRRLPAVNSSEKSIANEALRQAINVIVQSSGSDCTLTAIVEINKWLKESNKKSVLCLTVHDSVVIDTHKSEVAEVAIKAKHIMENLAEYNKKFEFLGDVPIVGEVEIGYNYADSFEIKDFDTTMSRIEAEGVDVILGELIAAKKAKDQETIEKAIQAGKKIPPYVTSYWNKGV